MAFPSGPSLNDTHTVGSNTWKWNGYAWDKQVAASGGGSGETADGVAQYNYTVASGALTLVDADANGEFIYNPDFTNTSQHNLSIFKFDKDGADFRDVLTNVDAGSNFTVAFSVQGSSITNYAYCQNATYAGAEQLNGFVYDTFPSSITGGNGKIVSLEIIPTQDRVSAGEEFRLPGGATFDTVVTSFAGFTGAVAAGVTTNEILYHDGSSINGSGDFTFDGTDVILGGDGHFDGGMDGPQQKKIKADEALAAGDPVYITGNVGASDRVTVAKADASDSAKMPAAGIVKTAFSTNQEGYMTIGGSIDQFNTAGYTSNDELYVSPGGGLTSERPISASDLVQKVVRVGRVDASTGTIIVSGANRSNDVPNLIHARAGISCDGGITLGSFISIPDTFDIVNDDNNSLFEVSSGRNVRIGDVDSFGNGNNILIRDSHDQINITSSAINLASTVVNIQEKLRHTSDTNTHLAFPANDEITLTTNGVTLAHLTDTFALQQGLSLDAAGITFPDGTHQTTAGGVSSVNGVTGAVNLSPGFEYVFDSDASATVGPGKFDTYTLTDDFISIHETTNDGITLDAYFDELADRGGDLVIMKDDGTEVLVVKDIGQFGVASDIRTLQLTDTAFPHAADPVAIINTEFSDGDVAYLRFDLYPPKTKYVASFNGLTGDVTTSGSVLHVAGISADGGITFPDGTFQTTVTRTDSYTGQIETASDKTYTLDPKVSTARTITGFYIKSASGTVTATLKNGSDTIKAASVSSSSGDQTSLANTSVAADAVLTLVLSSNSSALDVIFNVEYTSTS